MFEWFYNRRARAAHAYVKGAATGDASVCGRSLLAPDATPPRSEPMCRYCTRQALQEPA